MIPFNAIFFLVSPDFGSQEKFTSWINERWQVKDERIARRGSEK